jgi:molybdopterin/thiamine biosynthesis adenylyltransferase
MSKSEPSRIVIEDGRFVRFEAIEWWDQRLVKEARVLVVGAGALGNEIIKNLALLGVGHIVIVDMDCVEMSNLNRSILFRESQKGQPKAACAARGAKDIYPEILVKPIPGNVLADVGLGFFKWAQVVIGALDNREARVFLNKACALVGRPWIDGGIDVLRGVVRGFAPPGTACYECTMSQVDWELLNKRRSCSLLARRALANDGVPTTPTTASVIGAMQVQEVVKLLHGMDALLGKGFFYEGLTHNSYFLTYPIKPDCGWHEPPPIIESLNEVSSENPVRSLWDHACERLGGVDAIEMSRELVSELTCPSCGCIEKAFQPADKVPDDRLLCKKCGSECSPTFFHSVCRGSDLMDMRIRDLGLPPRDIVWARFKDKYIGLEIAGDPLGAIANSDERGPERE